MSFTLVRTPKALSQMVECLMAAPDFSWDHETRSRDWVTYPDGALDKMSCRADLTSFATEKEAFVVPTGLVTYDGISEAAFFAAIKPVMTSRKVCHNAWNFSFDASVMANYGVWVQRYKDYMVAAWVLDCARSVSLKQRCADVGMELHKYDFTKYWRARAIYQKKLEPKKKEVVTDEMLAKMEEDYLAYSAEDSIATQKLARRYDRLLAEKPDLERLFIGHRNPAVRVCFNMERRGLRVDTAVVKEIREKLLEDRAKLEVEVFKQAGKHFDLGSTKVLSEVLYKDLRLPVYVKTKKEAASTNAAALDKLAQEGYPIGQTLVKWRRASKLLSTYVGEDAEYVVKTQPHGHLHASFNITGTETGRLSSSSPNIQNLPRPAQVNYFLRREFIPSCSSYTMVVADYSQIELRVMADRSRDQNMIAEYQKDQERENALASGRAPVDRDGKPLPKSDLHSKTAEGTETSRDAGKTVNFTMLYGAGARRLAETVNKALWAMVVEKGIPYDPAIHHMDEGQAALIKDGFFSLYHGVKSYQEFISEMVMLKGYITTRFGYRRDLPDVFATDKMLQWGACRTAVNHAIQGHVAELFLHCTNLIDRVARPAPHRTDLRDAVVCLKDCRYRMLAQIHDELVGECPTPYFKQVAQALAVIFQRPLDPTKESPFYGYRVPLLFEAKCGENYYKAK